MRLRFRLSIQDILIAMVVISAFLTVNVSPTVRMRTGGKVPRDTLYATCGWPFHYLDISQAYPEGEGKIAKAKGWPRNSEQPWCSNGPKLIANILFALIVAVSCPHAIRFLWQSMLDVLSRVRSGQLSVQWNSGLRLRIIPTTLLIGAVPCLLFGSVEFAAWTLRLINGLLSPNRTFVLYQRDWFAITEACLALATSIIWLRSARAIWRANIRNGTLWSATGIVSAIVLTLVLHLDVYR